MRPCLLLFVFLAACGAEPEGEALPPAASAPASAAVPASTAAAPASPPDGAALYAKYCSLCHGANAEGYAADNAPSLSSGTFLASATDDFLRASIIAGRPGTAMAGYGRSVGGPLEAPEVDAIIAHLRRNAPPRVALVPDPPGGNADNGHGIYTRECEPCHGLPQQRGNAVHLFNPQLLANAPPGYLRYAVEHGRPGTRMQPWAGRLDANSISDVLAYVRSQAKPPAMTPPPQAPPVPAWGPIVLNPDGKAPEFTLRDGRFAPIDQVKKALDEKRRIVIVDARPPSDWQKLHIVGSLPLPYYQLDLIDRLPLKDGTWIVAYCACPHHASGVVVDELRKRGVEHSAVLDEGVFAWQSRGYPVVAAPGFEKFPAPPPMHPTTAVPPPMHATTPLPPAAPPSKPR